MSSRYGSNTSADWLLDGSPTGFRTSNMSTFDRDTDLVASLTTQVMTSVALPLQAGDLVTSLSFVSGATAAGTPTNWWFALYSPAGALLSQSADQLTAAWAASTVKTLALATPQMATAASVYYAAIMVKATTVPTLMGANLGVAVSAGAILSSKVLAQTSGSALTTTAPATIASPTTVATVPLVIAT
jgi:hypothetical protein